MEWCNSLVDVLRQGSEIGIDRITNHNSRVIHPLQMQGNEVTPIEGDDRPYIGRREGENLCVGHWDASAASFGDSHHIVSKAAEFQNCGKRD